MSEYKYAIVDCDSLLFSAFSGIKLLDEFKNPIRKDNKFVYKEKTELEIIESIDYLMNKIFTDTQCEGYICYVKGYGNFRDKLNPTYKSDREKIESPKFWKFSKEYLKLKYRAIEVIGYEVDDYVRITKKMLPDSFICAIDSDLLMLEGKHFNWRKNEWIETNKEDAKKYFWSSFICGTHNGLKGIPGKGIKYVEKIFINNDLKYQNTYEQVILNEFTQYYGLVNGIEEFYKCWKSIYLLEELNEFVLPSINIVNKQEEW